MHCTEGCHRHAQVLALLQRNTELNGFEARASVRRLDWRAWRADEKPGGLGSFELLLGADLLYASAAVQVRGRSMLWAALYSPMSLSIMCFLCCYLQRITLVPSSLHGSRRLNVLSMHAPLCRTLCRRCSCCWRQRGCCFWLTRYAARCASHAPSTCVRHACVQHGIETFTRHNAGDEGSQDRAAAAGGA